MRVLRRFTLRHVGLCAALLGVAVLLRANVASVALPVHVRFPGMIALLGLSMALAACELACSGRRSQVRQVRRDSAQ